ncbi:MAG TPA: VOC family protein [Acidimicrobiia bacterium]
MVINCADMERMSEFWCAVLDLTPRSNTTDFRVLTGKHGNVALQVADDPVTYRHQMHVDIYCPLEDRARECARVKSLGATYVRDSAEPDDPFVVFTDPEGNEFCVCPVADDRSSG